MDELGLTGPSLLTSLTDLSGGTTDVQTSQIYLSLFWTYFHGKFIEAAERYNSDGRIPQDVPQMQFRKAGIGRGSCDLHTLPRIVTPNAYWIIRFHALSANLFWLYCIFRHQQELLSGRALTCGTADTHQLTFVCALRNKIHFVI